MAELMPRKASPRGYQSWGLGNSKSSARNSQTSFGKMEGLKIIKYHKIFTSYGSVQELWRDSSLSLLFADCGISAPEHSALSRLETRGFLLSSDGEGISMIAGAFSFTVFFIGFLFLKFAFGKRFEKILRFRFGLTPLIQLHILRCSSREPERRSRRVRQDCLSCLSRWSVLVFRRQCGLGLILCGSCFHSKTNHNDCNCLFLNF